MSAHREQYLQRLGILRWELREPSSVQTATPVTVADAAIEPAQERSTTRVDNNSSPAHANAAGNACELHASREPAEFGSGKRNADWMIIGEAPGHGKPGDDAYTGASGELLDRMLQAAGYARDDVFLANTLECSTGNSSGLPTCSACLRAQIEWAAPKLVLCVGPLLARALLETDASIDELRGKVHHYAPTGTPLVISYHPAHLLREPAAKRDAWEDLKLAMRSTRAGAVGAEA